jgi:hypothetical protein
VVAGQPVRIREPQAPPASAAAAPEPAKP